MRKLPVQCTIEKKNAKKGNANVSMRYKANVAQLTVTP